MHDAKGVYDRKTKSEKLKPWEFLPDWGKFLMTEVCFNVGVSVFEEFVQLRAQISS